MGNQPNSLFREMLFFYFMKSFGIWKYKQPKSLFHEIIWTMEIQPVYFILYHFGLTEKSIDSPVNVFMWFYWYDILIFKEIEFLY